MSRSLAIFSAVCIVALFLGFIVGLHIEKPDLETAGRKAAARSDIANFKNAINRFRADCGYYPTSSQPTHIFSPLEGAEDSNVLIKRTSSIPANVWHGPYLDATFQQKDPWGRPYVYECPGKHNPDSFDVYSLGPNGKGGDEAIGNWTATNK